MPRGRGDRPGFPGLRLATGSGDLIEDIHRQQRRRTLKRAAQLAALAIALLLVGVAIKLFLDRRARMQALEVAHTHFVKGTPAELDKAGAVLDESIDGVAAQDPAALVARALVYAHRVVELAEPDAFGQFPKRCIANGAGGGTGGGGDECQADGAPCSDPSDCCGGVCVPFDEDGTCGYRCQSECVPAFEECTADSDCCGELECQPAPAPLDTWICGELPPPQG